MILRVDICSQKQWAQRFLAARNMQDRLRQKACKACFDENNVPHEGPNFLQELRAQEEYEAFYKKCVTPEVVDISGPHSPVTALRDSNRLIPTRQL